MKNLVRTMLLFCVAFIFAAQTPPSGKHKIKKLKTNTNHSDYAVAFLPNDKVVFVNPINDSQYSSLDLFIGDMNSDGEISNKKPLKGVAQNNRISKTGATFSSDYRKVYFSAREYKKKSRRKHNDRIFVADVDAKGNWKNIKKLPFNNDKYVSKDPFLSNDGKKLYFVSNQPSTIGGMDIFVVTVNSDGSYGKPTNLGETINTKGNEVTPFISEDNILYFSSNGREDSYGGLDVYASDITSGTFSTPIHLDASINRTHDEFAYIIKNDRGYFSSNDKDNLNIYAFNVEQEAKQDLIVTNETTDLDETTVLKDQPLNSTSTVADYKSKKEERIAEKEEQAEANRAAILNQRKEQKEQLIAEKQEAALKKSRELAEVKAAKEAKIIAKKANDLATKEELKAKEQQEEQQALALREQQKNENRAQVEALEAEKAAKKRDKKQQAIAERERIKNEKEAKRQQAIANKKEIAEKRRLEIEQETAEKRARIAARNVQKQQVNEANALESTDDKVATNSLNNTNENSSDNDTDETLKQPKAKYHIKYLKTNTAKSDYAVAYYNDKVVFVTPVDAESKKKNSDLFVGDITEDFELANKASLKGIAPSKKISKTGITYSSDNKTVYFSAKKNKKKAKDQLFTATIDASGNWIDVKKLPFNGKNFDTGQPTLSADGKKLYFSSNRPGSFGNGKDIFVVAINNNGSYGEPVNLGTNINTRGNEVTPFITKDNILYFSSTGHPDNQGGLDIYSSQIIDNSASEVTHLDAPVNGINNDFAFIKSNDRGYFSSNRLQGQDNNDIYSFILIEEKPKKCLQEIAGIVKDKETLEILNDAALTLFDEEGNQLKQVITDSEGKYKLTLDCNKTYTLIASSLHYVKEEHIVNTANYIDAPTLEANKLLVKKQPGEPEDVIAVTKTVEETKTDKEEVDSQVITEKETSTQVETVTDTTVETEVLNLSSVSVYYDFDSSEIRYDDTDELNRVTTMMKANPNVRIQVNAYTDARGSSAYNLALSIRRANAAINYIVSKGVNRNRLKAKGFGETQMVNHCVNGVKCSEAAHQMNRRTEFVILN